MEGALFVQQLRKEKQSTYIAFLHIVRFFQIQLDYFVPMEGALFVQQLRKEKQTGNIATVQKGVHGPSIKTVQRDSFHSHLCSKLYFLVLKHFNYFILYNCIKK